MKLQVTILMIVTILELPVGKSLALFKDGVVQYSSNIIHRSQSHPNRQGRSYTNYHFEPTDIRHISKKQRTLPNVAYVQSLQEPTNNKPQFRYLPTEDKPNSNDHQIFNVGYTISFANNGMPRHQKKQSRQIDDDIVIGTQGAQMPRPAIRTTGEEIVLNEFLDNKKRKLSGIKPKYFRPLSHGLDTKYLLAQANLSPTTQKKLEALQIDYESTTPRMGNTRWMSLSPSVEIYRSDSIFNNKVQMEQSKKFDHARALQKSILFDHTNAINAQEVSEINSNLERSYGVKTTPQYLNSYLSSYQ